MADTKLLILDVDGVMTDGGIYYGPDGIKLKRFSVRDGMGVARLQAAGISCAIISGDHCDSVVARAKKLDVTLVFQAVENKVAVATEMLGRLGLGFDQAAFVGDDVNDLQLLSMVGFSACPADAVEQVREAVQHVCTASGGNGCIREVADLLLRSREAAI